MKSPFHAGELEAQQRAGGGAQGPGIREYMPEQHRAFFAALPFVAVASTDQGWPVATLLTGTPGFVSSPDPQTLRIRAGLDPSDPFARALTPGASAGLLGIDLATRRRNRANGVVATADANGFVLAVTQSFGNCPQYIQARDVRRVSAATSSTSDIAGGLDDDARAAIARADTFFVASNARVGEAAGGVDISHRGGRPGFVRVDGDVLTIPDFRGNRYFNTLGNLVSNPRAALVFVDFERGDLLSLQGTTAIVWEGAEVRAFPGAERLWRVRVERGWRKRGGLDLRWSFRELAPTTTATGTWPANSAGMR
jgi:predicted pyridoxine 5'-phosphate oxidase superfamily flavin-nucleotide-binding protein